jgi:diguanylate cyclase (GGDEF)-like protein
MMAAAAACLDRTQFLLDQITLLISIGFSACALMLTLLLTWLGTRTSRYLLSWAIGLAHIVAGVLLYGLVEPYSPPLQYASFCLLLAGFAAIWVGAAQFRSRTGPVEMASFLWIAACVSMGLAFTTGLTGLGTVLANLGCGLFFALAAREHWLGRAESPLPQIAMAGIYVVTVASFLACAYALVAAGDFVLTARPANWAEDLNSIAIIIVLPAAGAVAMALHQLRSTAAHRELAMTDPLTNLLNRRALFDLVGGRQLESGTAVVMLDLDDFKAINDRFGHAIGDEVLQRFATIIRRSIRLDDTAARLGGEEFCLILRGREPAAAYLATERIRMALEDTQPLAADHGAPTVSAGIAVCSSNELTFEQLLQQADEHLYSAKDAGRNRVFGPARQLAA